MKFSLKQATQNKFKSKLEICLIFKIKYNKWLWRIQRLSKMGLIYNILAWQGISRLKWYHFP